MGVQQHAENFLLQLRNNRIERQVTNPPNKFEAAVS